MWKMYQVGELVVYGMHGVCRVVSEEERLVDKKRLNYLALEPLSNGNSRFLVPTQNAAAMAKLQPILSKEELEAMITSENVKTGEWIREENQRKQTYRELIGSGDRKKIMRMVHTLYRHKADQSASGRKIHLCDENFLHDAEKLLIGEISIVLHLEPEQARDYIHKKLKEDA